LGSEIEYYPALTDILQYSDLDVSRVREPFERVVMHLRAGDFRAADVKKLTGTPFYRAKLNEADRLLFRFARHAERTILLLLEVIYGHAYDRSRFLNGLQIDDSKLVPVTDPVAEAATPGAIRKTKSSRSQTIGFPLAYTLSRCMALFGAVKSFAPTFSPKWSLRPKAQWEPAFSSSNTFPVATAQALRPIACVIVY
jgi:hypothetical protein